jgi:pectate lyase
VGFLQNSATISQTISGFAAGMSYTISFDAANRARSGYATPQRWDVRIDGVTQASFANAPTSYTNCTVNFTATASSHTLAFVGTTNVDATVFLDNVRVMLNLPTSAPVFTSVTQSGNEIVMQGTNGPATGAYEMLRSTNVGASVGAWQGVGIRGFDGAGNFSFTNPISSEVAAAFYRVLVVSGVPVFAPGITGQPQDSGIAVGQNASFNVTATGTAPLTYRWYFNTNTLIAAGSSASLTITNAQLTNAGKYSATVSNLYGSTNSAFATLIVNTNVDSQLIGWASVAGYGMGATTGGGNATPQLVTTLSTLRTLASDSTPRVLILSGTFVTGSSPISIGNNKTLRGTNNAVIQGGIDINNRSNIVVQNLTIQGNGEGFAPADTAAARNAHHLWFDHVSFSDSGDGLLDITQASDLVTVSWCKFYYTDPNNTHRLASLNSSGGGTEPNDYGKMRVTYHHNWFSTLVDQRMPRVMYGRGHQFNNFYDCPGNGYCIGFGSYASVLIENNYFKNVKNPHEFMYDVYAYAAASGNIYDNCTGKNDAGLFGNSNVAGQESFQANAAPFTPPYSYTLDPAANVPAIVTAGAGPQ